MGRCRFSSGTLWIAGVWLTKCTIFLKSCFSPLPPLASVEVKFKPRNRINVLKILTRCFMNLYQNLRPAAILIKVVSLLDFIIYVNSIRGKRHQENAWDAESKRRWETRALLEACERLLLCTLFSLWWSDWVSFPHIWPSSVASCWLRSSFRSGPVAASMRTAVGSLRVAMKWHRWNGEVFSVFCRVFFARASVGKFRSEAASSWLYMSVEEYAGSLQHRLLSLKICRIANQFCYRHNERSTALQKV